MTVRAMATITLSLEKNIESYWRFYTLQSSTLAKPAKPTTFPPTGGMVIEYDGGSTEDFDDIDGFLFCVSEKAPTYEELVGGATLEVFSGGKFTTTEITSDMLIQSADLPMIAVQEAVVVISEDFEDAGETFKKGTYFLISKTDNVWVSKLTIPCGSENWTDAEPAYTTDSTDSLYFVDATVFSDGTFSYSEVSLSTSHEAAKQAHEKAVAAGKAAEEAAKTATDYIEYIPGTGELVVGNKLGSEWSGSRTIVDANNFKILASDGTELARYGKELISLGKNSQSAVIELCGGLGKIKYSSWTGLYDGQAYNSLSLESETVDLRGTKNTSLHCEGTEILMNSENLFLCSSTASTSAPSHIDMIPGAINIGATNAVLCGYDSLLLTSQEGSAQINANTELSFNCINGGIEITAYNELASIALIQGDSNSALQLTPTKADLWGADLSVRSNSILHLGTNGVDVLRLGTANVDGHYMFRPEGDGVTALGSTSQRWETVNAMILRSYDESTTSSGVNARVYNNRIYRYSSSSKRYKEDIKPIESAELNPQNLYNAEVVQFKYKPGYLIEGDSRENKEIPGFIVEDLEKIYPIAIDYNDDGSAEMWSANVLIPAMLKLIQEQNDRLKRLEESK